MIASASIEASLPEEIISTCMRIVFQDDTLLVVHKPAGLVCHPTKPDGRSSLVEKLRACLGSPPVIHLINRLDRETSGLVVVGKTEVAARGLRQLWETRQVTKEYLALVHGHPGVEEFLVDAPLGKDSQSEIAIKDCVREDGHAAVTRFQIVKRFSRNGEDFTLLRAWPLSGRKHQIRIHLAHYGHPVAGDKIYGADPGVYLAFVRGLLTAAQEEKLLLKNHALHAHRVSFFWKEKEWNWESEPDEEFLNFLAPNSVVVPA